MRDQNSQTKQQKHRTVLPRLCKRADTCRHLRGKKHARTSKRTQRSGGPEHAPGGRRVDLALGPHPALPQSWTLGSHLLRPQLMIY